MNSKATGETRHRMPGSPGSHVAYIRSGDLVVEWYDFGDEAPYESANLILFDAKSGRRLLEVAGLPACEGEAVAMSVASHFHSYFEVKTFATANEILFRSEVDFQP